MASTVCILVRTLCKISLYLYYFVEPGQHNVKKGYVHSGTILYPYRTGLIFETEKLTVDKGPVQFQWNIGYLHTPTISYRYRTGLIFGKEKLTVNTGLVRYRTSFGTSSLLFRSISLQNKQKKIWYVNKFQTLPPNKEQFLLQILQTWDKMIESFEFKCTE